MAVLLLCLIGVHTKANQAFLITKQFIVYLKLGTAFKPLVFKHYMNNSVKKHEEFPPYTEKEAEHTINMFTQGQYVYSARNYVR